jgi:hypothetical protein
MEMTDLTKLENWDTPLFPLVVVAQAALVAPATLRQWIVRYGDDLRLWDDGKTSNDKAEGNGLAHRFSLRTALHIAAAARLIAKGVTVKDAYAAVINWVHIGAFDRPAVWANEPAPELVRDPAGLFADPAWTFLIHSHGAEARVVGVNRQGGTLPFEFSDLFATGYPVRAAPTIVFLNNVDHYVRGVCQGFLRPVDHPVWDEASVEKMLSDDGE